MGFDTTRWSIILRAQAEPSQEARAALAKLCEIYWQPLYVFIRRRGQSPEDAEDLVQSFFARMLERDFLKNVDPARGKFRTFLLTSLTRFVINEHKRKHRLKRNKGKQPLSIDTAEAEHWYALQPRDHLTPEKLFERRWALTVMEKALETLRGEYAEEEKLERFEALEPYITNRSMRLPYSELAKQVDLSEGAIKVAVHRLRVRYRDALRREIGDTLANEGDVDAEVRDLMEAFAE